VRAKKKQKSKHAMTMRILEKRTVFIWILYDMCSALVPHMIFLDLCVDEHADYACRSTSACSLEEKVFYARTDCTLSVSFGRNMCREGLSQTSPVDQSTS
jgi:hypothetical protein